jgi:membrane protease YdiL (CAAX protease family)
MKPNWLLNNLETSQAFRLTLEIVIALVLFSWLPLVFQIIAGLIVSVVCEIIFAKIITRNLKNKWFFGLSYAMDGIVRNETLIEMGVAAIFVNCFRSRAN